MERPLEGKVAVVTGNAQGIGKGISLVLAEGGVHIIGNHVDPRAEAKTRAELTRQQIEAKEVRATSVVADITTPVGRQTLLEAALADSPEGIDYLILNAAGGLESGRGLDWAETINMHAQLALVDTFKPVMRPGGAVVDITSLWAHKYGQLEQLPTYGPVAKTKHKGEVALRERIPELEAMGIRLLVVCGYLVAGTRAHDIFQSIDENLVSELEEHADGGKLPTIFDMGRAARDLILSEEPTGSIFFVGGTWAKPLQERGNIYLGPEQIREKLSMYGPSKLRIDEFSSGENPQKGAATYRVRPEDCLRSDQHSFDKLVMSGDGHHSIAKMTTQAAETEGHFVIDGEDEPVYRGVDLLKNAAKAVILTWKQLHPGAKWPVITNCDSYRFLEMVFPANRPAFYSTVIIDGADNVKGNCEVRIGNMTVAEIQGITGETREEEPTDVVFEVIEGAAQTLILTRQMASASYNAGGQPLFLSGQGWRVSREIKVGDLLTLDTVITSEGADTLIGDCEVKAGNDTVAEVWGIKGQVLPNMELAQEIIDMKRRTARTATRRALAEEEN